jgi:two-component system response regulator QseB
MVSAGSAPLYDQARLLLIEDDVKLARLMERVLKDTYTVTVAHDGDEGLAVARSTHFDVMVIDRRLPNRSGTEIIEALRQDGVPTPILMLTALGTVPDKVAGLDAGANDYLVKPFDFDELLARLRSLTRIYTGEGPFKQVGLWEFYPASRAIYSPYDGRRALTEREANLLELFIDNPAKTFSRDDIKHLVFRPEEQPGTVDTYVHYVRRKTDKDMIETVRGRGYRLGNP